MTQVATQTAPPTTRRERGIALAKAGAVKPLNSERTVFHVRSSNPRHAPYTVRYLEIQGQWRCTCPDARKGHTCKHIEAAQHWLKLPRFLLTVTPRRSAVACPAYAPGVASTEDAALVRHHETGNITLDLPWSIEYVEFIGQWTTRLGPRVAVLRTETGVRWYVPLEAWEAIQPRAPRNPSPEVEMEMAMMGGAA